MGSKVETLLDDLGFTDPFARALMKQAIMAEMSVGVSDYIGKGGRTHTKEQCKATRKQGAPKGCVLHKPTLHKLTGSRQVMRSTTLIEDICEHGVGHPNPDSAAFLNWRDGTDTWFVHGCDGCCGPVENKYDYVEGEF